MVGDACMHQYPAVKATRTTLSQALNPRERTSTLQRHKVKCIVQTANATAIINARVLHAMEKLKYKMHGVQRSMCTL